MNALRILFGILLCCTLYFIPTGIAVIRRRSNSMAIFVLNLFLGWSIVGWVIALIWSVATDGDKKVVPQVPQI